MTAEEAIRCLSVHSSTNGSGLCTDEQHYEAKQMAIKAIEQTKWIPVSERLPKPQKYGDKDFSDWVEVTILIGKNKDAYVGEAYYCFSENKWYAKRFVVGEVRAWKLLPEPYKVE